MLLGSFKGVDVLLLGHVVFCFTFVRGSGMLFLLAFLNL